MVETDRSGEPLRAPGLAGVAQAGVAHGVWRAQTGAEVCLGRDRL